ncbi:MAG: EAL domain-containing protein [Ilumatobacteraceae bacterium]
MSYQPRVSVKSGRACSASRPWPDGPTCARPVPPERVRGGGPGGGSEPAACLAHRAHLAERLRGPTTGRSVAGDGGQRHDDGPGDAGVRGDAVLDLDAAGLPHGALELSEGEAIQNAKLLHQVLQRLGDRGVKLAIDDFGQGYSSMDRLRSLPLNEIKIDKGFVAKMQADPTDRAIVDSIIRLGHNLALDVVAEGVEDAGALESLKQMGCDSFQGNLFKGAVRIDEAVSLVRWQQPDPTVRSLEGPARDVPGLVRPHP